MTSENSELIVKIVIMFSCMILGVVIISIGISLENLLISGFGGTILIATFIGGIMMLRNI